MKKIVALMLSVTLINLLPVKLTAQNVGVGTTTPTEKLEIKNPLKSTVKISAGGLSDTTQLIFSNSGSTAGLYTDFFIKSIRENGLFFSSQSDFPANNSASSLVIRPGGNVGIGANFPANRLQVHENVGASGYMNITNTTTGSNGTDGLLMGVSGSAATLTNLENGSLQLGTNNITRVMIDATGNVGIGISIPAFKLDVVGDINTTGLLRLNGNSGAAGQVLTSNGASDPIWANAGPAHYVGELFGGGIIVGVWKIAGVEHGLIVSLTNLSTSAAWSNVTSPVGTNANDGQANTSAIIAEPGHINSAAKLCNDFSSGGFTDWYLPAAWELYQCFTAAYIVNTITGATNGFLLDKVYWSSTEDDITFAYSQWYGGVGSDNKNVNYAVRAVRKF